MKNLAYKDPAKRIQRHWGYTQNPHLHKELMSRIWDMKKGFKTQQYKNKQSSIQGAKDKNRMFPKEDVQMKNKLMKKSLTSLALKEAN